MSAVKVALLRERGRRLEISKAEWQAFDNAKLADALAFYLQLRGALRSEYAEARPFNLPATKLAAEEFLPGHRDRKLYLRLTSELARLDLIERVKAAGFAADGQRVAAAFMFKSCRSPTRTTSGSKIVFLDHHRNRNPLGGM
jgi:hypothetical protein